LIIFKKLGFKGKTGKVGVFFDDFDIKQSHKNVKSSSQVFANMR